MKDTMLRKYENVKSEIDEWFANAVTAETNKLKMKYTIICIFCIGKAYQLADILKTSYGENLSKEMECLCEIRRYLQLDFLENLEV